MTLWPDSTRYGRGGAVCAVDHLASAAGLDVLRVGAAIAANAVLAVTTQQSCGMGGDLRSRGHQVERATPGRGFGHAHVVVRRSDGTLAAASDPRAGTGDAQAF